MKIKIKARMLNAVDSISKMGSLDLTALVNKRLGVLQWQSSDLSGEKIFIEKILPLILAEHESPIVFDVGLNEGNYSTRVLKNVPSSKVFGFEPNPETFARVAAFASQDPRWEVFPVGMSNAPGRCELHDYGDKEGSSHASIYAEVLTTQHRAKSTKAYSVQLTTIDKFLVEYGIDRINFMKIDTEGHELAVLEGASDLISRHGLDAVQFEFNEMNVVSRVFMKDFYNVLPSFSFYRLRQDGLLSLGDYDTRNEIFKFQNILAVKNDLTDALSPFLLETPWR